MRLCFVGSSGANLFMTELLEVVAAEVAAQGVEVEHAVDAFPPLQDGLAYCVIPHEFFDTVPTGSHPSHAQLARTLALCVEQPGTPWFEIALEPARACGAVVDISPVGARELELRGVPAERIALGWTQRWDGWGRDVSRERPIEVLYMGSANRRRELALSGYAGVLWRREHRLLIPPHTPKTSERPDFVLGERKNELLGSAQTVLNVRRQSRPYFEWVRALEAICNGAVLVCEHGAGFDPLVPGEHFVAGGPESLAFLADGLLREPERLEAMRLAAYDLVREALPMAPAAARIAELAAGLAARPAHDGSAWARPRSYAIGEDDPLLEADRPIFDHGAALARAVKRLALESQAAQRAEARAAAGNPDAIDVVHRSEAWDGAVPRVSVCVPLYRHAGLVGDALRSVAASDLEDVEVVVLDDASDDGSSEAVVEFSRQRPWLALTLLRRAVNAGLPAARNALIREARAPYVLMLDADNELRPPALGRLADALDADPGAFFAYPILECHRDGRPDGLLSSLPWEPERLREHNPIDALALLRRDELIALGGYVEDPALHGWEDYELWCRCAATGRRGVHVPMLLARYRRGAASMLSVTDLDTSDVRAALHARHPQLFSP